MTRQQQEEFLALLKPLKNQLWRYALAMTKDSAKAEDLMSETILAAYERFELLRDAQAFPNFLYTIATRLNRHHERRMKWFGTYDPVYAESLRDHGASPDAAAEVSLVYEALSKLPQKVRETLTLHEVSGFTLEEIKAIQGGSLSGVKSRLVRGREKLIELLGEKGNAAIAKASNTTAADTLDPLISLAASE